MTTQNTIATSEDGWEEVEHMFKQRDEEELKELNRRKRKRAEVRMAKSKRKAKVLNFVTSAISAAAVSALLILLPWKLFDIEFKTKCALALICIMVIGTFFAWVMDSIEKMIDSVGKNTKEIDH